MTPERERAIRKFAAIQLPHFRKPVVQDMVRELLEELDSTRKQVHPSPECGNDHPSFDIETGACIRCGTVLPTAPEGLS